MRRFVVAGALLGVLVLTTGTATAAWADGPLHEKRPIFSGSVTIPAGELCDFTYQESFSFADNAIIFGDPDDPARVITQVGQQVTHTNLDTGFTLTEVDHYVIHEGADQARVVGIFWHLRDADGKIVLVQSGQLVVNTETGEIVKVTPAINPDFAAVICPALGGQPAG